MRNFLNIITNRILPFLVFLAVLFLAFGAGYVWGIKQAEEKIAMLPSSPSEIQSSATSAIYYLFGTLTDIQENRWTLKPEGSEEELTIMDELTEYPPTYFITVENETTISRLEEIKVGDIARIDVAITSGGKVDVISITKLSP